MTSAVSPERQKRCKRLLQRAKQLGKERNKVIHSFAAGSPQELGLVPIRAVFRPPPEETFTAVKLKKLHRTCIDLEKDLYQLAVDIAAGREEGR